MRDKHAVGLCLLYYTRIAMTNPISSHLYYEGCIAKKKKHQEERYRGKERRCTLARNNDAIYLISYVYPTMHLHTEKHSDTSVPTKNTS